MTQPGGVPERNMPISEAESQVEAAKALQELRSSIRKINPEKIHENPGQLAPVLELITREDSFLQGEARLAAYELLDSLNRALAEREDRGSEQLEVKKKQLMDLWNGSGGKSFEVDIGRAVESQSGLVMVREGQEILIFPAARTDVNGITFNKFFDVEGRGRNMRVIKPAEVSTETLRGAGYGQGEGSLAAIAAFEVARGKIALSE